MRLCLWFSQSFADVSRWIPTTTWKTSEIWAAAAQWEKLPHHAARIRDAFLSSQESENRHLIYMLSASRAALRGWRPVTFVEDGGFWIFGFVGKGLEQGRPNKQTRTVGKGRGPRLPGLKPPESYCKGLENSWRLIDLFCTLWTCFQNHNPEPFPVTEETPPSKLGKNWRRSWAWLWSASVQQDHMLRMLRILRMLRGYDRMCHICVTTGSSSASKQRASPRPSTGKPTISGHCCWEHVAERNNPII